MSVPRLSEEEIQRRLAECDPANKFWLEPYLRGTHDLDGFPIEPESTEEHLS